MKAQMTALNTFAVLALAFTSFAAHAGSSVTTIACSSESGRTILSGYVPGQGEEATRVNFSIGSDMMVFQDDALHGQPISKVDINQRDMSVRIEINAALNRHLLLTTISKEKTNLKFSRNGVVGSFIGKVTGTNPADWNETSSPIVVRCFLSDQI